MTSCRRRGSTALWWQRLRLAKYIAHAGVTSRRAAEGLIRDGRVRVDGELVRDPAHAVDEQRDVRVDGRRLTGPEARVVLALHKPAGVVSTARDTHGRPTVVDLVGEAAAGANRGAVGTRAAGRGARSPSRGVSTRLYPIGRLDADTTGLILLTNDGELAHRLTHPRFGVEKVYRAQVAGGPVGTAALRRLRGGVELEDGLTAPARVRRLGAGWLEITLREGRKRQVRRMCEAVGHPVLALERVRLGSLELGELPPGAHRQLSAEEVAALRAAGAGL